MTSHREGAQTVEKRTGRHVSSFLHPLPGPVWRAALQLRGATPSVPAGWLVDHPWWLSELNKNGTQDQKILLPQFKVITFTLNTLLYRFQTLIAQLLEHIDLSLKGTTCVQHSLNGVLCKSKVTQVEKQCFGLFSLSLISAKLTVCSEYNLCKQENMVRSWRGKAEHCQHM